MRVTQVVTGLHPAGAERIVSDLSRGLLHAGHEIEVISLMPFPEERQIPDELREAGIPVRSLGLGKANPWVLRRLPNLLATLAPDVVHAHMYHANLAVRIGARRHAYKIVNTIHLIEPRLSKRWLLLLDRLSRGSCDAYTAVSKGAATFHAARLGVPVDQIRVIHNGIPPLDTPDDGEVAAMRNRWGVGECRFVLGAAGRLSYQKGFDLLLDRLSGISNALEGWGLVILGDGPEMETLSAAGRRLAPDLRVVLPGFEPEASRAIGAFDGLVVPSRYEGFGLVVAEAMAHGIPILASGIEPLAEIGAGYPGIDFIDFEKSSDRELADAFGKLAAHRPRAPYTPFSSERMITEYLALYQDMLDS